MKQLISNVVIGVSGSTASILAAKYGIVMARNYHCRLTMVYVVDTATIKQLALSKIFVQDESAEYERNMEANGQRYLAFMEELANAKGVKIEKEIRKGAVFTEILAAAEEHKADVIIMGGWEKDRPAKDIISHAHHEIILHSKCSVLIVKEPEIDLIYKQT